jgi:hypothetical protein
LFTGARRTRQSPDAASTDVECPHTREPCPNQSISLRTLHCRLLHPVRSPAAARLTSPTAALVRIPRHSPNPSFSFFPHLAGARGKATRAVLGVLFAVTEVDARRTAPRCTTPPAPQTREGSPLRERAPRPPSSAHGRGRCAWRGGRCAGEGAAAIPGPIIGAVAIVEVARVAALGQLLGCGGATPSPQMPP